MSQYKVESIHYQHYEQNQFSKRETGIIVESPVSLTVNGEHWLTFMCTPTDLDAMVVGFLYNEGVIADFSEVENTRLCKHGDNVDVWLSHNALKPDSWLRTSGCSGGLTSIIAEKEDHFQLHNNGATLSSEAIPRLLSELFSTQELYRQSGGVHTSALSDGERIVVMAEDIGRHNTLDKIAGLCLMEGVDLPHRILITTGRISSEMLQKSARLEASIVISRTSPSSLSVTLAKRWGITLIGYARRTSFRVYTHTHRILNHAAIQQLAN